METVLSGIRPTGNLHLGNYFGAVKNFVKMQHENNCFFFIADYHSLTTHPNPENLQQNVKQILVEYLAAGINPEIATLYVQICKFVPRRKFSGSRHYAKPLGRWLQFGG